MPDKVTEASTELRARIARSRCRFDRQLFQWADDTFWFRRAAEMIGSSRTRRWGLGLGAAFLMARWIGRSAAQRRETRSSSTLRLSDFLDWCGRYLRVWAWKARRAARHAPAESSDE